jgi:hypothetical protein
MERKIYKNLKVVEIDKLGEFGFEKEWSPIKREFYWTADYVAVYGDGVVDLEVCQECVMEESLLKLYDMIKAGIVEKV